MQATTKSPPRRDNDRGHGNGRLVPVQHELTALIAGIVKAAEALEPNEAIFLPSSVVIARSNTGRLRFGTGTVGTGWFRGDAITLLRDHFAAVLDWTQTGHFAQQYRRELAAPYALRSYRVANVGLRSFHALYPHREPRELVNA